MANQASTDVAKIFRGYVQHAKEMQGGGQLSDDHLLRMHRLAVSVAYDNPDFAKDDFDRWCDEQDDLEIASLYTGDDTDGSDCVITL